MEQEISQFETSEELGKFLASTPLLSESWKRCTAAAAVVNRGFVVDVVGEVGYVGFSGVNGVDLSENQLVEIDGGVAFKHFHGSEDEDPPMVHVGFLQLFLSVYNNGNFQIKMGGLMEKCKSIIFTGHSIGGALASLASLWLMSLSSHHSVLCITFGSPLLGNESLAKAILRERWGGNFINVVSKHDIVPRLLFAPLTSLSPQLNSPLHLWLLSMTCPPYTHLASDNQDLHLFHRFVADHVAAAAMATKTAPTRGALMRSPFTPFGSYLFSSVDGTICLDNLKAVVMMLHLMFMDSSVASCNHDHLNYGEIITRISQQFLQKKCIPALLSDSSSELGISSALYASGLTSQTYPDSVVQQARECLIEARRMGSTPNANSAKLVIRLAKVTPLRAQIEWYRDCCNESDDGMGYYDSFKLSGASRRDSRVNMNRIKLASFWNDVVEMVETNQVPHDFQKRPKWVNASQFYKLLVEPLDIAHYYKSGLHLKNGHYLKHGRPRRYEIFDKWWSARKLSAPENYKREKYAGLTQDSCFWARVEEATEWLKNVRTQNDSRESAQLWDKIDRFEQYAKGLVDRKEVSKDVLARDSSYNKWLGELNELKSQVMQMAPRFSGYMGGDVQMVP